MRFPFLLLTMMPLAAPFAPISMATPQKSKRHAVDRHFDGGDGPGVINDEMGSQSSRRELLASSLPLAAFVLGINPQPSNAAEQKIYSSNARNMARLNSGDSSGGSVYDNNPSSPKARARRAMVGCKNTSARSLAGDNIGKKISEKECNQIVMAGETDFMLGALTELDCPTCPYGIETR